MFLILRAICCKWPYFFVCLNIMMGTIIIAIVAFVTSIPAFYQDVVIKLSLVVIGNKKQLMTINDYK